LGRFGRGRKISPKSFENLKFKLDRRSKAIPTEVELTENFLLFSGLWFADGCFDGKFGTILSVGEENCVNVFKKVCGQFGLVPRVHSDGFSQIVSNTNFAWLLKKVLEFKGNAYSKEFPQWVFNLSLEQQGLFLNGLFSGDGYATDKEIAISLVSNKMSSQLQAILLNFNILSRTGKLNPRDKTIKTYVGTSQNFKVFSEKIGFVEKSKAERLEKLCLHNPSQDAVDTIPLSIATKQKLAAIVKGFNSSDYITRNNSIGRRKLQQMLLQCSKQTFLSKELEKIANAEIFWDEIVSIEKIESAGTWVYDFSIPKKENFVCQNILAHNTLEIPVPYFKRIGFNIQRLKTRSPISVSKTETEVAPEEALRTALRLGDSALVIGEVRSKEAKVLYEAMRVGAAGNIVIGTIHGDSAYAIWDRVVNDLGVPNTSFKATDLVVVARPIRFSGSMKRSRRVVQITEVKKHWTEDPEAEGGLLDLMLYDAKKDELELLEDNLKESELFDKVRRVSGLTLDQIWSEIRIRAESKKFLVDLKRQNDLMEILEAENYVVANNKLILIKEEMLVENGKVDYDQALGKWKFWVKNNLLKRLIEKKKSAAQFKEKDKE